MDITHLSDIEYKYIFNINDIIEARTICNQRYNIIKELDQIPDEIKKSIKERSNDINSLLCKVIDRIDIRNSDEYDNVLNTAILANSEIQFLIDECVLQGRFGKFSKKNPLYKQLQEWESVHIKLGAKDFTYIATENHKTMIGLLAMPLLVLLLFVAGVLSKTTIVQYIFWILAVIFFIIFIIFYISHYRKIQIDFDLDYRCSVKNSIQYRSKSTMKSAKKEILNLLIDIWKKNN